MAESEVSVGARRKACPRWGKGYGGRGAKVGGSAALARTASNPSRRWSVEESFLLVMSMFDGLSAWMGLEKFCFGRHKLFFCYALGKLQHLVACLFSLFPAFMIPMSCFFSNRFCSLQGASLKISSLGVLAGIMDPILEECCCVQAMPFSWVPSRSLSTTLPHAVEINRRHQNVLPNQEDLQHCRMDATEVLGLHSLPVLGWTPS